MDDDGTRLATECAEAQRKLKRLLRVEWNSVARVTSITIELELRDREKIT